MIEIDLRRKSGSRFKNLGDQEETIDRDQDLKKEVIAIEETKIQDQILLTQEETIDRDQDLKKEVIAIEETKIQDQILLTQEETIDRDQDLKKEVIEIHEMIDQAQDLKKNLLIKKVLLKKIDIKINFIL